MSIRPAVPTPLAGPERAPATAAPASRLDAILRVSPTGVHPKLYERMRQEAQEARERLAAQAEIRKKYNKSQQSKDAVSKPKERVEDQQERRVVLKFRELAEAEREAEEARERVERIRVAARAAVAALGREDQSKRDARDERERESGYSQRERKPTRRLTTAGADILQQGRANAKYA